jgi:hypothetical protein
MIIKKEQLKQVVRNLLHTHNLCKQDQVKYFSFFKSTKKPQIRTLENREEDIVLWKGRTNKKRPIKLAL